MLIIQRPCAWCGLMMDTKRSHTRLHGKCHMPFHRLRNKLMPGEGPGAFFAFIKAQLANHTHPNPKHTIHQEEENAAIYE